MEKRQAIEFLEYLRQDRNLEGTIYGDALNMAIEALKAQLSSEDTTSDTIDRQETIDRFNVIRPVDPKKDEYTKGIDVGIAMCIVAVKDQPSAQPVATDTNVGGTISRQAAIDIFDDYNVSVENGELEAYRRDRKRLCELPTIQPEECAEKRMETHACDLISRQAAIDALDKQIKQCCKALGSFSLSDVDKHAVEVEMASLRAYREMLEYLPTVQPEPTDEQVFDYCKKRCLYIVTADVFQSTHLTHKVSFGDKDHVWIDGKQYISLPRFQEAVKEAGPKEGKWVYGEDSTADCVDGYRCSQCGFFIPWDYNHKFIDYINDYAYCPNCGARMKGEI